MLLAAGADKKEALHKAVEAGDVNMVSFFLSLKMNVNSRDLQYSNETPLHYAATFGEVECVDYLIQNGANVNVKDCYGNTPLHNAVKQNWLSRHNIDKSLHILNKKFNRKTGDYQKVTGILIKNGARLNIKNNLGKTPLHLVAENGIHRVSLVNYFKHPSRPDPDEIIKENIAITTLLLNNGAEIEAKDNEGFSPVYCAINRGNREVTNLLMKKGANLNNLICIDENKKYPVLFDACHWGLLKIAKKLIDSGADVNYTYSGLKPVHLIVRFDPGDWKIKKDYRKQISLRKEKITKLLISKGADINAKTSLGKTPLDIENEGYCPLLAKKLKKLGARYSKNENEHLKKLIEKGKIDILKRILISHEERVWSRSKKDETLLHFAVEKNNLELVKFLVVREAEVNAKTCSYLTPLHIAIKKGNSKITKYLISKGADVNAADISELTPIYYAAEKEDYETVKFLLEKGANPDGAEDFHPIIAAGNHNNTKLIKLLISYGADVNSQDQDGNTVLHYAEENENEKVAEILLDNGGDPYLENKEGKTPVGFSCSKWSMIDNLLEKRKNGVKETGNKK